MELMLKDEVYAIVGAAMEVYNVLGSGFLEAVYQEAMELELADRNVPFEPQKRLTIHYTGQRLTKEYVADVFCCGQVLVELKAQEMLLPRDEAQLINYLNASQLRVGLLINFGHHGALEWKRMIV